MLRVSDFGCQPVFENGEGEIGEFDDSRDESSSEVFFRFCGRRPALVYQSQK